MNKREWVFFIANVIDIALTVSGLFLFGDQVREWNYLYNLIGAYGFFMLKMILTTIIVLLSNKEIIKPKIMTILNIAIISICVWNTIPFIVYLIAYIV